MSLWSWLKQTLLGQPPARDISRLDGSDDPNSTSEAVDVTGGPLKPGHRRLALRDRRLLPKATPPVRSRLLGKRRDPLFPDHQARRLFSPSGRTGNRSIRDLTTDIDQLSRLDLPVWRDERELADALGLSLRELWFFASHRQRDRFPHYVTFAIPKRSGGERLIMAPKRKLKALQRKVLDLLVSRLPVSGAAHAFRKGRSIRTGAEPHVGHRIVVRLDLTDFFPTVTWERVRGLFIALGYSFPVAATLALLVTEAERQPVEVDGKIFYVPAGRRHCVQGAPTSPGICNAIVQKMDHRLTGLAKGFECSYTRYADDLTFSGDLSRADVGRLIGLARKIVTDEGFTVNESKTRIQCKAGRQSVTGVTVNQILGLSRQERRELRAAIHHIATGRNTDHAHRAFVEGKLAYLTMLNPEQAAALKKLLPG